MKGSRVRAESHGLMERDSSEASPGSGQVVKARGPSLTRWRGLLAHLARALPIHRAGCRPAGSVWWIGSVQPRFTRTLTQKSTD